MQESKEISISDVVKFLASNGKLYLSSVVLFIIIALGFIRLYPTYTAAVTLKYSLQNKPSGVSIETEDLYDSHLDLINWRSTQDKLSILAALQSNNNKDAHPYLKELASQGWWTQHVAPIKPLSTDEAKELLGINSMIVGNNKPTEESNSVAYLGRVIKESTRVSGLLVSITASDLNDAINKVEVAGDFIDNAAGVIRYRTYLSSLEQKLIDSSNKLRIESSEINEALKLNIDREQELIRLHKEYPQANNVFIDGLIRQENTKYLPLSTQLVALNIENHELKIRLKQLDEKKQANQVNQLFIDLSYPVVEKNISYKNIYKELMDNELQLRNKISKTDFVSLQALDKIRYQLITLNKIASAQIVKGDVVVIKRPDYLKSAIKAGFLGLVVGMLLSILLLIIRVLVK